MSEKKCWACASPVNDEQVICLACNSWQNWRRYLLVSNSTIALLVALLSLIALLGSKLQSFVESKYPDREVHIAGFYTPSRMSLTLQTYNFGDSPASLASNVRCFFGLQDAMLTALGKVDDVKEGTEVEFWSLESRIVEAKQSKDIEFGAQTNDFPQTSQQVLCFSALNYLSGDNLTEDFLLTIVPNPDRSWWPVEVLFAEGLDTRALYEKISGSK